VLGARRRFVIGSLAACTLTGSASAELAASSVETPLQWRRHAVPGAGRDLRALAFDPERGRLALGDPRGLVLRDAVVGWRRWRTRAAVRDLAFAADGTLWIATEQGLWRLEPDVGLRDSSPASGQAARDVRRVAVSARGVAIATRAGVYWRSPNSGWREVDGMASIGPAISVTLAEGSDAHTLWILGEQGVFRVVLDRASRSGDPVPLRPEPFPLPRPGWVGRDLAAGWGEAEVVLLGERALFVLRPREGVWSQQRVVWPPALEPRRLAAAAGRLWIATDRGLLEAPSLEGPWRRARPPAGSEPVFAVVEGKGRVFAATASGLLLAELGEPGPVGPAPTSHPREACDPPVIAVHRAALAYLQLGPDSIAALRRGVRRRGFLPVISLRATRNDDRNSNRDYDEAFLSGALRSLFDREYDRSRDLEIGLTLTWDLRELVYHPERVEVSEEARRLIALRDDVLDEINQLYFERRRVLDELLAGPPDAMQQRLRRRRAEELTAGLDAWTGGWFGRRAASRASGNCPSAVPGIGVPSHGNETRR
jgi:hypothetical protein